MRCRACSGTLRVSREGVGLLECRRCRGLHGTLYRGEATALVGLGLPMLDESDNVRYFDLDVLGSDGIRRLHGWYDPVRRRVVQYG